MRSVASIWVSVTRMEDCCIPRYVFLSNQSIFSEGNISLKFGFSSVHNLDIKIFLGPLGTMLNGFLGYFYFRNCSCVSFLGQHILAQRVVLKCILHSILNIILHYHLFHSSPQDLDWIYGLWKIPMKTDNFFIYKGLTIWILMGGLFEKMYIYY